MAKFVAFFSTICLFLALLWPGRAVFRRTLSEPEVLQEVRGLNELATVRYTIQKVVGMDERKSPVGSEKILLLVQARVVAGVDLAVLGPEDIAFPKKGTVRLRLAPPRILEAYIDEKNTQVWDRGVTWWTPWVSPSVDLEHKARLQALEDVRAAALQMGILGEARKNAESGIRKVLEAFGMTAEIRFDGGPKPD